MTDYDTDTERLQRRVAEANKAMAAAATTAAGDPTLRLRHLQTDLASALRATMRALEVVESELEGRENATPPGQITSEHYDRLAERYDEPLCYVAGELLQYNRWEYLERKPDTNGAASVERHGLTENQRRWLDELEDTIDG